MSALLLAGALLAAQPARAEERVLSFHGRVTVRPDSVLEVEELIRVESEGREIRRGIYRDFPTRYRGRGGHRHVVGFKVLGALRDGSPEAFRVEPRSNGERVYLGRPEVLLPPGVHEYRLRYQTTRQVGYFKAHDELYWNATGNGWGFRIEKASAEVQLPAGASGRVLERAAYTGPQGSRARDAAAASGPDGSSRFETTAPLPPGHGLTVVVAWPKGFVREPSFRERTAAFLKDNGEYLAGLGSAGVVAAYYLLVWLFLGRDPPAGTIVPAFEPPRGLSPAAARFVSEMGYDDKVFAAALIGLAVRGRLKVLEKEGTYSLERVGGAWAAATPDEEAAETLLGSDGRATLTDSAHRMVSRASSALERSLKREFERTVFVTNLPCVALGLALTALCAGWTLYQRLESLESSFGPLVLAAWTSLWTVGCLLFVEEAAGRWKDVFVGWGRVLGPGGALAGTLVALPFLAVEALALWLLGHYGGGWIAAMLAALGLLNVLFFEWLKAPTLAGRRLMDELEGFKRFLASTEKGPLNALHPKGLTPRVFEKYLPYALALGVEVPWSEKFSEVLAEAGEPGRGYRPAWFSGRDWGRLGAASFASSLGTSMADAISSSSTPPGSSSGSSFGGGGGGFSGGGGGGGGGGGW